VDRLEIRLERNVEQNNQLSCDGKNSYIQLLSGLFRTNLRDFEWKMLLSTA